MMRDDGEFLCSCGGDVLLLSEGNSGSAECTVSSLFTIINNIAFIRTSS